MFTLSGNISDLPLPHILQVIGNNQMTGRLVLTRRDGQGLIVFRDGKIIYAASNTVRETFGNILINQRLISEATLMDALSRQAKSPEETRLGTILVEMGVLEWPVIEDVVRGQIERVIGDLMGWDGGFAAFEALAIPDRGEVAVDASDFILPQGLDTQAVILGLLDWNWQRTDRTDESGEVLLSALDPNGAEESPEEATADELLVREGLLRTVSLGSIMTELRSPAFPGEVSLGIMKLASQRLDRGVLLLRTARPSLRGMGQFGVEALPGSPADGVRGLRIPIGEPSVFLEVMQRRETFKGPLEQHFWNLYFVNQLGEEIPREVVVVPMVVDDRVEAVLYGDNLPSGRPIKGINDLEAVMIEAGLVIEKSLL
ncbi:MAG TPA: DUF4388 domain-containing protein, partial [Thermoanaerobaculia bacterium]|nr:DUF4388 domain-containing protein [Thermoanaerobaculia bacterium]